MRINSNLMLGLNYSGEMEYRVVTTYQDLHNAVTK